MNYEELQSRDIAEDELLGRRVGLFGVVSARAAQQRLQPGGWPLRRHRPALCANRLGDDVVPREGRRPGPDL